MKRSRRKTTRSSWQLACAAVALIALSGGLLTGCDDEIRKEFVAAASDQVESGLNALVDGLITGVFAVAEPDDTNGSGTGGDTTGDTEAQ